MDQYKEINEIKFIRKVLLDELSISSVFPIPYNLEENGFMLSYSKARCMLDNKDPSMTAYKLVNPITNVIEFIVYIIPYSSNNISSMSSTNFLSQIKQEFDANITEINEGNGKDVNNNDNNGNNLSLERYLDSLLGIQTSSKCKKNSNTKLSKGNKEYDYFKKSVIEKIQLLYEIKPIQMDNNDNKIQYQPPSWPVISKHVNFIPLRDILISKKSDYIFVISDGSAPFSLESLSKYNRHALRYLNNINFVEIDENININNNNNNSALTINKHQLILPTGNDPILYNENDIPLRFIWYQILQAINFIHSNGMFHGALTPNKIHLTPSMWVQLEIPSPLSLCGIKKEYLEKPLLSSNPTRLWINGNISNFDYLMMINAAAGRRLGDSGSYHPILPWVSDFLSDNSSSFRDLKKSKFRLNKGDRQLDTTYSNSPQGTIHHIPESLSEITYFMYLARLTPLETLKKIVRSSFDAREYPSSMARLYEWTPDESIPELFTDPQVFSSIHGEEIMPSMELPSMSVDSSDNFIKWHREKLESPEVSRYLHKWIDINFGVCLSGKDAIENMNVPLPSKQMPFYSLRRNPGFFQVFSFPHPMRNSNLYSRFPNLDIESLSNIIESIIDPNSKFLIDEKYTFIGKDLINWMTENDVCKNDSDGNEIINSLVHEKFISLFMNKNENITKYQILTLHGTKLSKREKLNNSNDKHLFNLAGQEEVLLRTDSSTILSNYYENIDSLLPLNQINQICEMQKMDIIAIGKIISEIYLNKPLLVIDDLSILPLPVSRALQKVLKDHEITSVKDLIEDEKLWPELFPKIYSFLSSYQQVLTWEERLEYFVSNIDDIMLPIKNRGLLRKAQKQQYQQKQSSLISHLLYPIAIELMEETINLGGIGKVFCALHPYSSEPLLLQITNNVLDKALIKDQFNSLKLLPALFFQGRLLEFVFSSASFSSEETKILRKEIIESLSSLPPESIARIIFPSILERWRRLLSFSSSITSQIADFAAKSYKSCGENVLTALFLPQATQIFETSCSMSKWNICHDILDSFILILPYLSNHEIARTVLRSCHIPKNANEQVLAKYYQLRDAVVNAIVESASSSRRDTFSDSNSFSLDVQQNRHKTNDNNNNNNRRGSLSVIKISDKIIGNEEEEDDDEEDDEDKDNNTNFSHKQRLSEGKISQLSGSNNNGIKNPSYPASSSSKNSSSPRLPNSSKKIFDNSSDIQSGDENVWILGGERKLFRRLTAHKIQAHSSAGVSVIEIPENLYQSNTILTGSRDGEVCIWNVYNGTPREKGRFQPINKDRPVSCIKYNTRLSSPDILVGDGINLSQWDVATNTCIMQHIPGISCFEPLPLDNGIVVGTHSGDVGIIDSRESIKSVPLYHLLSPSPINSFGVQTSTLNHNYCSAIRSLKLLSFGTDNNLFACGRDNGQVSIIDFRIPGRILNSFSVPNYSSSTSLDPVTKIFEIKSPSSGYNEKNFNLITVCGVSSASLWEIPHTHLGQSVERVRVTTDISLIKLSSEYRDVNTSSQDYQQQGISSAFPVSGTILRDGSNILESRRRYSTLTSSSLYPQQQYVGESAIALISQGNPNSNDVSTNNIFPEILLASSNKLIFAQMKTIPSRMNDIKLKSEPIFDGTRGKRFRKNELQINSLSFLELRDLIILGGEDGNIHAMI